jgi:hypothetical protein
MPRSAPRHPCHGDVPLVVVATAARTALWTVVLLALWCVLPAALGWHVTTVASDSMAPRLLTGDVVGAAPIAGDAVHPGQVLLVDDPDHVDRLRLHRLVRVEPEGLRLRGDANGAVDSSLVAPEAVHGVGVLRVPGVGAPGVWLRDGQVLPLLALAAAAALAVALTALDRPVRAGEPCSRCGAPRRDLEHPTVGEARHAPSATTTVVALVVVTVLLATATASDAAFSATTGSRASASTETFPCFAGPQLDSPVLAWDFSEPRGVVVRDRSGRGHDGRLTSGAVRNDASCAVDPSAGLGALDSRVMAATTAAAPSTFSVEAWFRTERASGRIVGFSSSRDIASPFKDRHLYIGADGTLQFGVQGSNDFRFTVGSRATVADGEWHHAVGTFRPGSLELWLDGELQGRRTDNGSAKAYSGSWRVGRDSLDPWPGQPADYTFHGAVDTVRVYDQALDTAAVAAHLAAGR